MKSCILISKDCIFIIRKCTFMVTINKCTFLFFSKYDEQVVCVYLGVSVFITGNAIIFEETSSKKSYNRIIDFQTLALSRTHTRTEPVFTCHSEYAHYKSNIPPSQHNIFTLWAGTRVFGFACCPQSDSEDQ